MAVHYIDPVKDLGGALLGVEKPARYTGGEFGCLAGREAVLRAAAVFPDLYEIGMSNQALRILYNELNRIPGVSCDRAFAPAPDFESLLRERRLPLYGLDTGAALGDLDMLCFTLGFELGVTGVLTVLGAASIPIRAADRSGEHPLVIMGGPCVSNPLPYQRFVDAFWIGEAEGGFFDLIGEAVNLKRAGAGRGELLSLLLSHPSVWAEGKAGAVRAVDLRFSSREGAAVFPVPSMRPVQHHGAVEIMRGCPNGCRFCHAGFWYRPMRQKSAAAVRREAEDFIRLGGYREICLSSLSTGDYASIDGLAASLNRDYASRHISFQLPSLRVSSFSLPLLEKISAVRKSGLTFAVETPEEAWQAAINKRVTRDSLTAILQEAKKHGWRTAKFYFMIGLPVGDYSGESGNGEEQKIVEFIADLSRRTGMRFNVNAGTFIPKPHTPYERVPQIDEDRAREKLDYIRSRLKPMGHKVGIHDPFTAKIEGILSRGDGRVGDIIEEAYRGGCRFDAWTEYLNREVWKSLFEKYDPLVTEILGEKDPLRPLPWGMIDSGIHLRYLPEEYAASNRGEFTSPCIENCTHRCGICAGDHGVVSNIIQGDVMDHPGDPPVADLAPVQTGPGKKDPVTHRILFSFSKKGRAVFLPHLSLIEVFSMAFVRAALPILYSRGFNPLPALSFASPLSIGISAAAEIACIDTEEEVGGDYFTETLNRSLPGGLEITRAAYFHIPSGAKKYAPASILWGYTYEAEQASGDGASRDYVAAGDEKQYRLTRTGSTGSVFGLNRTSVLAKDEAGAPDSYFNVYQSFYTQT